MDPIKEFEKVDEFLGLRSLKLQPFLARRQARRITNVANWLVTILVLILGIMVANSVKKAADALNKTIVTETVTVRDTIIVTKITDMCPRCNQFLPFTVGKTVCVCPNCNAGLIRPTQNGKIFSLED